jgi:three-Cys-motif partner protein
MSSEPVRFDTIGYWSEIKLEIIGKYAKAYSTILSKQPSLRHVYIDAFAGAGQHISRATGTLVPGSPAIALAIEPQFNEYHFIDLDVSRVAALRQMAGGRPNVLGNRSRPREDVAGPAPSLVTA